MEDWGKRLIRIMIGLFLFAVGNVLTINAQLGVAPWVVFDQGVSNLLGITVGQANILAGLIILIVDIFLGQAIGWGSVLNMLMIGIFMDILMLNHLIPMFDGLIIRFIVLIIGVVIQGFGTYYYIAGGLGAGPRDGLMVALTRRGNRSFRFYKTTVEIMVVLVGYSLGGDLGLGTIIMALLAGQIFQSVFNLVKFDVSGVSHRFIQDDIVYLKDKWNKKEKNEEKEGETSFTEDE